MDREKYIELYSNSRIDSYSSIDEQEANFEMIGNIAPKLARIEIIIRNRIDRKMCEKNRDWMFDLVDSIELDDDKGRIREHDILVSRQTFGFWIRVVKHYKIHSCAFDKEFLDGFSFKKYYEKNKERLNKIPLSNYQKAYGILLLIKSIRNRAFHFENLLKLREFGVPRLSVRVDFSKEKFYYFNIKPNMIIRYLDDILQSFDKDLS